MSRSASSSPLRKKPRLSSPTYDAHFDDLNSDDFQALDDIEAKLSQDVQKPALSYGHESHTYNRTEGRAVEHEFDGHDDSGIMLVDGSNVRHMRPTVSQPRNMLSQKVDFASAASLRLERGTSPTDPVAAFTSNFTSAASLAASSIDTSRITGIQNPPSLKELPEQDLDSWFATSNIPLSTGFASASAFEPAHAASGLESTITFNRASGKAWAPPSATALEAAKVKLQIWEAEIESELSVLNQDAHVVGENRSDREPLKVVENSVSPPSPVPASGFSPASANSDSRPNPPRPFKAPAFMTPLRNRATNSSNASRSFISNPVLARSSAATGVTMQGSPLKASSSTTFSTPRHAPSSTLPPVNILTPSFPSKPTTLGPTSSPSRGAPQKAKPLGLTPRAHAFTGSKARPKFVTPFKQGMAPGEQEREALSHVSQPKIQAQPQHKGKGKSKEIISLIEKTKAENISKHTIDLTKSSDRKTLAYCGLIPRSFTNEELTGMGFDAGLFNLTTVSHFLYYRFNPPGTNNSVDGHIPTQTSFGADSALSALLASGCHLATKAWVDNHWPLILWKLIGMSCLDPTTLARRWCWTEVMRQLRYRYTRELANGVRPALRLVTTQDAPTSGPLVLCISDVFWTEEYVDTDGRLVLAHPVLELTDGWYRLRATVDEALARATRNRILRVGRKISCSGARLESSKKDPMEVLDAYESTRLLLSGNSTHLAQWHAKLGFQPAPFVATLGSMTSDGGSIALVDLLVTQVFPVGYIEYITTESGEQIREGPRTEKDEAQEEDKWKERRAHEAMKLRDELEKKLHHLESYADRLERIAGSDFQPTDDESPPDNVEDLAEELEDSEDPASLIKRVSKQDAGWLSQALRKKCEVQRERGGDEIDRELATTFPPRQVRNFRVLRVQDARTVRKPSTRTAQLTVWDVMSLNVTEGSSAGSFAVGQRYMVTSLVPTQPSAWMGHEPGSEVFLSTRRDSKWKVIR